MPSNKVYNLAVLVSGGGSNLQSIIDATHNGTLPDCIVKFVVSNKKKAYGLERAKLAKIDHTFINPKSFNNAEDYDKQLLKLFKEKDIDIIILAGYLKILTKTILEPYKGNVLNIHPSLLPKFGGMNMYGVKVHEAVIAAKEKTSGCTVHIVTEEVDKGPIIDQIKVEVQENDTPEILAKRILPQEHILFPRAINKYIKQLSKG